MPPPDEHQPPVHKCASWARAESSRALVLASREAGETLRNLARRARELDVDVFAGRVERLAGMLGIATEEIGVKR